MYFEDYSVGMEFESGGRTVTDSDIRMFIGATNATHDAHLDAEFAKKHPFGRIAIQGVLLLGIVDGFVTATIVSQRRRVMHYGYNKIWFLKPVFVGDTVRMKCVIAETTVRNDEFGTIRMDQKILNQDHELVCVIDDISMIERRPQDA